jgi:hypothetical protein
MAWLRLYWVASLTLRSSAFNSKGGSLDKGDPITMYILQLFF